MNIKTIAQEIHATNVEKGFWDDKATKNVGEVLMLCVSELSEGLEAHRHGRHANLDAFESRAIDGENERTTEEFQADFQELIKDTFEDEMADTVIRVFDLCEGFGIDLERHIRLKLNYNKTRPYKHGKKY